ncbi:MAG TPA: YbjN domain-containing protein [Acidimicrobiales bacterium]|nr:YbjN domain-containing protein [Acidimicrobiales bacterium]
MADRTISLVEPEGSTLDVGLVTAGSRAGLPSATFELDAAGWERVESEGLLHADPARRRSGARPFDPLKPVIVEAVLDPVAAIEGVDALADRLLTARLGDPLLSSEAWWALSATQEVDLPGELGSTGTLHEGISFEHPRWLQDAAGSVGLEEAWQRAMDLQDRLDEADRTPLLDRVVALFEEQEWSIDRPNPDATIVHAGVASDAGDFNLYVRTDEERHLVTAFAVLEQPGSEAQVPAVFELASRLNEKCPVGSYEVDHENGLLSFKAGIDVTGDELSDALARRLIGTVLIAGERANEPYAEVAAGRQSPAVAAEAFSL